MVGYHYLLNDKLIKVTSRSRHGRRQGLDGFQKSLRPCALDESSLSTGRVKEPATKFNSTKSLFLPSTDQLANCNSFYLFLFLFDLCFNGL